MSDNEARAKAPLGFRDVLIGNSGGVTIWTTTRNLAFAEMFVHILQSPSVL